MGWMQRIEGIEKGERRNSEWERKKKAIKRKLKLLYPEFEIIVDDNPYCAWGCCGRIIALENILNDKKYLAFIKLSQQPTKMEFEKLLEEFKIGVEKFKNKLKKGLSKGEKNMQRLFYGFNEQKE